MQDGNHTPMSTPLDQPELHASAKQHPALTWLIVYGAYILLVRMIYAFVLPLMSGSLSNTQSDLQTIYHNLNLLTILGNIALSVAIIISINHKLCRAIFAITVLMNIFSLITTLFIPGR